MSLCRIGATMEGKKTAFCTMALCKRPLSWLSGGAAPAGVCGSDLNNAPPGFQP